MGRLLLLGFAVAAAGGPLCLLVLYLVPSVSVAPDRLVWATLVGLALFVAPLAVWRGYARVVASDGGQYAFVAAAAGERLAWVQGVLWTVAYVLYLPYTVTYIVFYLLPYVWPLPAAAMDTLELALPVAICVLVAFAGRAALWLLAALAGLQVLAIGAIAAVVLGNGPAAHAAVLALPPARSAVSLLRGGGSAAGLLVCMSLVVFLGGEARGGGESIRWSLGWGYAVAAALVALSAVVLAAGGTPAVWASDLPGVVLATARASPAFGSAVGLLVLVATAGLIVAEFLALVRLWRVMLRLPDRTSLAILSAMFVVGDAISLIDPWRFYSLTIAPSLIALWLSQLVVFAVYPRLRPGGRGPTPWAWLAAVVAGLWSLFGLWGALTGAGLF